MFIKVELYTKLLHTLTLPLQTHPPAAVTPLKLTDCCGKQWFDWAQQEVRVGDVNSRKVIQVVPAS